MSTTTQILFNSPALHSLKRDQLVKLCKIHSLKASGKKKELIERLQFHATTLPPDDPLSIATRKDSLDPKLVGDSEDETSDYSREGSTPMSNNKTRPTEQWEVVMDTIAEVDEETLRSNRAGSDRQAEVGEFGTHTSKVSVTSSLKAIANSLGLKRGTTKSGGSTSSLSSLSSKDVAQLSSTPPTSDPSGGPDGPPAEPVPGQSNLRGRPAPSEARLSFSQAPATTTIRLVSNPAANPEFLQSPPKLQPFATSFDLVPCSPGGVEPLVPVWPLSPGGGARDSLYPPVPTFQGFGDLYKKQSPWSARYDNSDMDIDVDMPGGLAVPSIREPTPEKANAGPRFNTGATPKSVEKPSAEPADLFSPAPKPLNASSRSKLNISRSEPFVFGSPLPQHNMSNLQFRTAAQSVLDEMNKRLAQDGVEVVDANVLNNRHTSTENPAETQESNDPIRVGDIFDKIHQKEFDKMDSITSHYAAKRGVQNTAQPILSKKRKSSLVVKERQSGAPTARHRPNGSRVASGASVKSFPGHLGEEDEEDEIADRRLSKRPRVEREEADAPVQPERVSSPPPPDSEEEARKQKEREAIRRRLEYNRAKRRSSMGRPSLGHAPTPKAKPVRLGFFASAKSLVQNVWNRGAGTKTSSNVTGTKPARPNRVPPKAPEVKKTTMTAGPSRAPSLMNVPGRSTLASPATSGDDGENAASGRISRPPIPSFEQPSSSAVARSSTVAGYAQSNKRSSSIVGFSSLGKKVGPSTNDVRVSSTETKVNSRTSVTNMQKPATGIPRSRTLSTLMAPTASSLAKMNAHSRIPVSTASHNENSALARANTAGSKRLASPPQLSATLEQITNSPRGPTSSSRPTKIFSQPLSPPSTRPLMSLTAAATSIVGQGAEERGSSLLKPPIPPKPKVLPGRKPRISRSKVIARLASQRAAGTAVSSSASTRAERTGGKVRSSMGVEVAGKARQSYGGAAREGVLMSAKKRVRQSEQARRRSRAIEGGGQGMSVD